MHGHYVVSEQGLPLGVLGAGIILRNDEDFRQAANRRNLPIEEKESHRWIEGHRRACAVVKRPPKAGELTLQEFIAIIGKLGGHLGRKSDGDPGPRVIWRGLSRVRDFACVWRTIHEE